MINSRPMTLLPFLLAFALPARGEELPYAASRIPAGLRSQNAAVVRMQEERFEVLDAERARYTFKRVATIFSKEGRGWAEIAIHYNRFREIENLDGTLYDAGGEEIRDLASEDVSDVSDVSDYSLHDEDRLRHAALYNESYPYTVAYEYEVTYKGSLNWPVWYAQHTEDAVERTSFEVTAPAELRIRTWCNRDTVRPVTQREGSTITYRWEAAGLPEISRDAFGYPEDITTIVRIAPLTFVMDGSEGRMDTWKSFGSWFARLTQGRDVLPPTALQDLRNLVKPDAPPREKVRRIYSYLQSRTRYVSIQLGLGAWQPFEANFVHDRGYGDCKALSNYAVALLKAVGVTAYPVLIYSGSAPRPIIEEFPSNQFNHMIVCAPLEADTVWLECTSQTIPFGHLVDDTQDRGALLVRPEGGVLVRTPRSSAVDNAQIRSAHVVLKRMGGARITMQTRFMGAQQDRIRANVVKTTPEERRNWVLRSITAPNAVLKEYQLDGIDRPSDTISIMLTFDAVGLGAPSGNRLFLPVNKFEPTLSVPRPLSQRLSPIRFSSLTLDRDSVLFELPEGCRIEALPPPVVLDRPFARFEARTELSGVGEIVYTRTLEFRENVIPLTKYEEYRKFCMDVVKADRMQAVVLLK